MSTNGEDEIPLTGGWVTAGVVKVGDTVRRPPAANAELAHRLLVHLEGIGFDAAPRFLGTDEQGREILRFIDGTVPSDCRAIAWSDDQLETAARLLRRYHDATAGTERTAGAEVVCHNDFGPWNLVWRVGLPQAIIDFDNAAPGRRIDDLGYAIWKHLNVGLIDLSVAEQRRRMAAMCAAYGMTIDDELRRAIEGAQERMRVLIDSAPDGRARDEALRQIRHELDWLRANGRFLFA